MTLEGNLLSQTDAALARDEVKYPYTPDIIIGHNGQQVLLEVITASQTMRDIGKPDGSKTFRYRILQGLHANTANFKVVAIPVTSVVDYDIENLKVVMNEDYNFLEDMNKQLEEQGGVFENPIHFHNLAKFGSNLTGAAPLYYSSLKRDGDKQKIDGFLKQLCKLFSIKYQTEKQYERAMYRQGLDQLKFELMKLSLLYDAVPMHV